MTFKIPEYQEIVSYVLKTFGLYYEKPYGLEKLCINGEVYSKYKGDYKNKFLEIENLKPKYFIYKNIQIPVFIYNNDELFNDEQLNFDISLNVFLLLSGIQEWIINEKDQHLRFQYKNSVQCKFDFANVPVVNAYFDILYKQCLQKGLSVTKKNNSASKIIITHDIDQLNTGWAEDIKYYLTKQFSILNIFKTLYKKFITGKDSLYIACEKMLEYEKEFSIKSIYFFIPDKSKYNADYKLGSIQVQRIIKTIKNNDSKIGIHPGLWTFDNLEKLTSQKTFLEEKLQTKVIDSRQHFLQIDVSKTFDILIQNGISLDYSLGFAEHTGFRNSFSQPFYPFDFKTSKAYEIISIPLYLMDATLAKYYHGNLEEHYKNELSYMKIITENFDNEFSVVFHNTAFRDTKYASMKDFFKMVVALHH